VSAGAILTSLRSIYPSPEYAFIPQVAEGTGVNSGRIADALAFSCWPSRGLHFIGFEVKVSRSDWRREKLDPAKAEAICKFCKYWFVAAPQGIVPIDEVPETWGLIECGNGKPKMMRKAIALTPQPLTTEFVAAIMRRLAEHGGDRKAIEAEIAKAKQDAREEARTQWENNSPHELKIARQSLESLQSRVDEFEKASGVRLDQWKSATKIGQAVKAITDFSPSGIAEQLEYLANNAERIAELARSTVKDLNKNERSKP
jgi:hypothetical protein